MELADTIPKGQVLVLADGKTYTFGEMTWNVQEAIQTKFGIDFMPETEEEVKALAVFMGATMRRISTLRFTAWRLLRKNHPELSEEAVGDLITAANQAQVIGTVVARIVEALPFPEEKKKEVVAPLLAIVSVISPAPNGTALSSPSSPRSVGSRRRK